MGLLDQGKKHIHNQLPVHNVHSWQQFEVPNQI